MKKLILISFVFATFVLPFQAQDNEALVYLRVTKEQIPQVIESAINIQFNRDDPATWSKFPFALEKFGWVYDFGVEESNLNHFKVEIRTNYSTDYTAIYSTDGELIRSTELTTKAPLPAHVMDEFLKSEYKDWRIISNREIINLLRDPEYNTADVEHNFRIRVEKEGVKRNITFRWKGNTSYPEYYTNVDHFMKMQVSDRNVSKINLP